MRPVRPETRASRSRAGAQGDVRRRLRTRLQERTAVKHHEVRRTTGLDHAGLNPGDLREAVRLEAQRQWPSRPEIPAVVPERSSSGNAAGCRPTIVRSGRISARRYRVCRRHPCHRPEAARRRGCKIDRPRAGTRATAGRARSSTARARRVPRRNDRPAARLVAARVPGETQSSAQRISDPVAVEVGGPALQVPAPGKVGLPGRSKRIERPPRLRRLTAEGPELTFGLAPEVDQAVAVQVGDRDLAQPHNPVQFSSRRSLQDMHGGGIEV